ncbi:MAG TPA: DUF3656 domain-containing protein [Mobilitalea sp.]|nr:DUF3656 domain-containing protein [Mobilitalea sp.]
MKRQIEILAPAGSYEGMKAAMNAGCDAVYIGGSSFGARAFANNLEEDTLLNAIDEAHIRDKKLYLTVNTLLKEKELSSRLYSFLEKYYLQGLDAVIVQDVGVLHFIHEHFPGLPVHASTQMTLTMAQGANLLKDYGVTRLVTSRELSLNEIKKIRENTELEIETFVHGALCYCYSGQCLMSSMIGGRSGNRGRCAQPCRMPYQFYSDSERVSSEQEKYLLSPKDINTLAIIPELIEAGIDSFKIEGRMKRPEYAAAVSSLYRKYVDYYLELGKAEYHRIFRGSEFRKDMIMLQDVYNRGGFSEGYGNTYHGKSMMSLYRPNHSGVYVGEVKEFSGSQISITVKENIHAQDILEIRHLEEECHEFTVKDPHNPGDILRTNVGNRSSSIHIGDQVYRTKNNELLEYLENEYIEKDKKLGIKGLLTAKTGERLSFTASYGTCSATAYQDIVQQALKQPMTREKLISPLEKTGDTLYYFHEIQVDADDNIFVPVAWLNEIRRDAIRLLEEAITGQYRRILPQHRILEPHISEQSKASVRDIRFSEEKSAVNISVAISIKEQFKVALESSEVTSIHVEYDLFTSDAVRQMALAANEAGKAFYLLLPYICRLSVYDRLKKELLEIIDNAAVTGFIVRNFEEASLLQSLLMDGKPGKDIILNYNMYVFNKEAKAFWTEKSITHYTAPLELNYQELKTLGIADCDIVVYGYLPLMISAQCLFESTKGCRKRIAEHDAKGEDSDFDGYMTDRIGKTFFVRTNCRSCNNVIYNGQALALHKQAQEILDLKPASLRLDFTRESALQMQSILDIFIKRFIYDKTDTKEPGDYTTGHYKRGVE